MRAKIGLRCRCATIVQCSPEVLIWRLISRAVALRFPWLETAGRLLLVPVAINPISSLDSMECFSNPVEVNILARPAGYCAQGPKTSGLCGWDVPDNAHVLVLG